MGISQVNVVNRSRYEHVEEVMTYMSEQLLLDTVTVLLTHQGYATLAQGHEDYAILRKLSPRLYRIYLSKRIPKYYISTVLTHELVHIQQYQLGKLFFLDQEKRKLSYNGDVIDLGLYEYKDRPHEIDAQQKAEYLVIVHKKALKKVLK
ncbi:hypothetical protein GCM10023331_29250 [Algivirga pacifica]|uniref:SprT-like domain-containing protein n=2 Tax=Algivirga pacifica TaxID=1162670 RepID=A0ABP9DEA3_9BACT